MSSGPVFGIGMGAAVAFPASARPGAVLLGQTGAIAGQIAIADDTGTPQVVFSGAGSFVPSNDNATDLGSATHRFRSLYLGTSITNAGDLAIDLTGALTRTLTIENSTGGQVCDLALDGDFLLGADAKLSNATANQLTLTTHGAAKGLRVSTASAAAVNGVEVQPTATGTGPTLTAYGDDAAVDLNISAQGGGAVTIANASWHWKPGAFSFIFTGGPTTNRIMLIPDVAGTFLVADSATDVVTHAGKILFDVFRDGGVGLFTIENSGTGEAGLQVDGNIQLNGATPELSVLTVNGDLTLSQNGTGTINLNAGATGSVQIGNNAASKIGMNGLAPVAQSAAIPDAAGGATVDAEARAAINTLLAYLRTRGDIHV